MGADPLREAVERMREPKGQPAEEPVNNEPQEETSQDDTKSEAKLFTVKTVDGEESVTEEELKLGYMREKDYRKKTQTTSEKAKELQAKLSALDEKITDAEALVELDLNYLESEEGKKLRQEDPEKFLRKSEKLQERYNKLKSFKEEKQKRAQEKQKERIKEEQRLLSEKISDWLDEDVKIRETKEIISYLEAQGYTQEEIANLTDHRVFVTAREAVKLKKIMDQDLSAKETRSTPKSAKPGSTESKPSRSKEEKLRDKLKKSHHMNDAAALLKARLFK